MSVASWFHRHHDSTFVVILIPPNIRRITLRLYLFMGLMLRHISLAWIWLGFLESLGAHPNAALST